MSDHLGTERLEAHEIEELKRRLAERGAEEDRVRVAEIAEAVGASPAEVTSHLDQLRAERAFSEKAAPKRTPWPLILAISAIGISGFFIARGLLSEPEAVSIKGPAIGGPTIDSQPPRPVVPMVKREDPVVDLMDTWLTFGYEAPPPKLRVQVTGNSSRLVGDGTQPTPGRSWNPSFDVKVRILARSIWALANDAQSLDKRKPKPRPGTKYRDFQGNVFEPKPGYFHYCIVGECTPQSGELPFFSNPPTKAEAERVTAIAKLALTERPTAAHGMPPGFSAVVYARTKIDIAKTFGPLGQTTREALAKRIAAAIMAAIDGDRTSRSNVPMPALTHVVLHGPQQDLVFDVPTATSEQWPTKEAVDKAAKEIVERESTLASLQVNP